MKTLFIITSAVNSRFGVHSPEQRTQQTIDSIKSVRALAPDADIAVVEMGGTPPTAEQVELLKSQTDYFYNFSEDAYEFLKSNGFVILDRFENERQIIGVAHLLNNRYNFHDFGVVEDLNEYMNGVPRPPNPPLGGGFNLGGSRKKRKTNKRKTGKRKTRTRK